MKTKIVIIMAFVIALTSTSTATTVWIDSVNVIPEQPLETDIITFDIVGRASSSPSEVGYDEYAQNGTSLQLDLYVDMGISTMISDWTYEKQIGTLNAGTYSLEVRAFDNYDDTLQYTSDPVYFTVVPEPTTFVLFSFGLLIVRPLSRRKRQCPNI